MDWRFVLVCNNDSDSIDLVDEPMDWEDYTITMKRDPKVHGRLFGLSNSLTFYGEGYSFIRAKYDTYGVAADIVMQVFQTCDGDEEQLPDARVNITTLEFTEGDICAVTASMEEATCIMQFKNRADLKVSLFELDTVDDPGVESLPTYSFLNSSLQLLPKVILKTNELYYEVDDSPDTNQFNVDETVEGPLTGILFQWLKGFRVIEEIHDFEADYADGSTATEADVQPFFIVPLVSGINYADYNLSINYHVRFEVDVLQVNSTEINCAPGDSFEDVVATLILRKHNLSGDTFSTIDTTTFSGCHTNLFDEELTFTFDGAFPFSVTAADEISLYLKVEISGEYAKIVPANPILIQFFSTITDKVDSFIKITVPTTYPATNASVGFVNEALSRIVEKLTGDCLKVYSSYFGRDDAEPYNKESLTAGVDTVGCGALEAITNGLLTRKVPLAKLFISWNELYNSLDAIHALGMGLEDDGNSPGDQRIRVERALFFYEEDYMHYFIEFPTTISRSVKTDIFFTKLNIGYSQWESDEFNGLDEFCTKRVYTTNLTQIGGELQYLSSIIASGYAIEVTRQQGANTKDWRYDNSIFIICTNEEKTQNEHGNISAPLNLIDPPSVYNFRISPARNAIRHFEFLFTIFKNINASSSKLIFSSGDGNYIAEGKVTGGCVPETDPLNESQDLFWADKSDSETVLPRLGFEQWNFEYPMSFAEYLIVRDNFYKLLPVKWEEDFRYGYLQEVNYRPAQSLASFRVLAASASEALAVQSDFDDLDFDLQDFLTPMAL